MDTLKLQVFADLAREFVDEVHANAVNKGFWETERSVGESIALIHSELSEALEAARQGYQDDPYVHEYGNFEVELADAVIRIMDLAQGNGVDLIGAMLAKHEFNKTRPRKHGKAF